MMRLILAIYLVITVYLEIRFFIESEQEDSEDRVLWIALIIGMLVWPLVILMDIIIKLIKMIRREV